MEEDLKILDKYLEKYEREYVSKEKHELLQAIENLLQAYKQDEKVIEEMAIYIAFKNNDVGYEKSVEKYFRKKCE